MGACASCTSDGRPLTLESAEAMLDSGDLIWIAGGDCDLTTDDQLTDRVDPPTSGRLITSGGLFA